MGRNTLFNGFFFLLLAFMLYEAGAVLWPSGGALLGAVVLAVIFYPVHQRLRRFIKNPTLRAGVSDFIVFTFFLVPGGLLVWAALAQSGTVIPLVAPMFEGIAPRARLIPSDALNWISDRFPWLSDQMNAPLAALQTHLAEWINRLIASLPRLGAEAAKFTIRMVGYVILAVVALFFFFRDGEELIRELNRLLPLRAEVKTRIEEKIRRMVIGVFRGSILTSVVQGVTATIGFLIIRTPSAFLLGLVTMLLSVVPILGTALIWGPMSYYYFWSGSIWKGAFLLIWGMLVTGSIDNFLRPWLIGVKEDVPFFWLFFSIVGGLQVFGLFGLLIGPLVMAVLMILLDIYQQLYLRSPLNVSEEAPKNS